MTPRPTVRRRLAAAVIATGLIAAGCSLGDDTTAGPTGTAAIDLGGTPGNCTVVDLAVSSEKIKLLSDLAKSFNQSKVKVGGRCVFARPQSVASGKATTLLATNWNEDTNGPRPVIWSPASSAWGAILNQRLANKKQTAMAPTDPTSFMLTPLVIAMPKPMADALGYPAKPIGWTDILRLARDPQGWAAYGHPQWGPFRLGKTNPNFSTSGLSALIAQNYAATKKTSGLTLEDLDNPATVDFNTGIESAVVHYGDITGTFLNNWYRADRSGTALTYASAVAVEEKSVIDYNKGNPDGVLDPGEVPKAPKTPLVAVYPSEGTLYSNSPFFVLDAPWVSSTERKAAQAFSEFVQKPSSQKTVLAAGFRPGNPSVKITAPISADNGVDPDQPQTLLDTPEPKVMATLLDKWADQRKKARVLLVLDVSGSMKEPASDANDDSKLDLAKAAAIKALEQFQPTDNVGLRIFSTRLGPNSDQEYEDLVPIGPIGANREQLVNQLGDLVPQAGTPLYDVAAKSFDEMLAGYDPAAINAVVFLTDGRNDDGDTGDDASQRQALVRKIRDGATGENSKPVKFFTIGYGQDADQSTLAAIAEASNAKAYNASNAASIDDVFTQVISNF